MPVTTSFGELLRHLRKERGVTQQELARRAGVTSNYVALLEAGRRQNPSRRVLTRLCDGLTLDNDERDRLHLAAQILPPSGKTPQPPRHIAYEALRYLLQLPAGSPQLPEALRKVIDSLLGVVAQRSDKPARERKLLRRAQLLGLGYFHARPKSSDDEPFGRSGANARKEQRLAEGIAALLTAILESDIDLSERIRLVAELKSYALWRTSGQHNQPQRPKLK